jgi:hypothetical protein
MTRLARWWLRDELDAALKMCLIWETKYRSLKHAQKLGDTETRAVMNGDFWVGEEWR